MESGVMIFFIIVVCIVFAMHVADKIGKKRFCKQCHNTVQASNKAGGSFIIEVILYLLFIVPGLIYSVWRMSSKRLTCPECGSTDVVHLQRNRLWHSSVLRRLGILMRLIRLRGSISL